MLANAVCHFSDIPQPNYYQEKVVKLVFKRIASWFLAGLRGQQMVQVNRPF